MYMGKNPLNILTFGVTKTRDKNFPYEFFLILLTQHPVISYSFLKVHLLMLIVSTAKIIQGMQRKKLLQDLKIKPGFHQALNCYLITKNCLRAI